MERDQKGWWVSPAPDGRGTPKKRPPHRVPSFWALVAIFLVVNWLWVLIAQPMAGERVKIPFSPYFVHQVQAGAVKSISSKGDTIKGVFKAKKRYPPGDTSATPTQYFSTQVPSFWSDAALTKLLQSQNVEINAQNPEPGMSFISELLFGFGPTLLFVLLFVALSRQVQARGGGLGDFARSRARRVTNEAVMVTFDDVAGIDEAKAELTEIVDFLRKPEYYVRLGGRIPHGVLLFGAPGTGKTLLARAVASEARAAFFSIAASEFVEAIVGVGAARVRDLFAEAKKAAPSIVFIDEVDAIGRARQDSRGFAGSNDEREQTLDQILAEMDGFDSSDAVVVLAATNRPDVLDAALLRPGRFDRRVSVPAPDRTGRLKILKAHTRKMPLARDVDLDAIASTTPGMVGADLANLANEAALLAARRGHAEVRMSDFTDALEKVTLGAPTGVLLSRADRERTAYHEAGHALVGMLTPEADPVRKVSIIPRGRTLGVTFSAPDNDRVSYSREELEAQIKVALGGRVAEEIVYGRVTTGAEADLEHLTQVARHMVGRWGMSDAVGLIVVQPGDRSGLPFGANDASPQMLWIVDQEVRRLVDFAHTEVAALLAEHREQLDDLAAALLKGETLDAPDAYAAAGVPLRTTEADPTAAEEPTAAVS